jgi:hypothetical protein
LVNKNTSLLSMLKGKRVVGVLRSVDVLSELAVILGDTGRPNPSQ